MDYFAHADDSQATGRSARSNELRIAVLLPCHNEALSIAAVVRDYRRVLPGAAIYVYDNCSADDTAAEAARSGAIVRRERWPGKGNVVRRMFADIDADVYVIADGDGTYDADAAPELVQRLLDERVDMVVGVRSGIYREAHRAGHGIGNMLFNRIYAGLFGRGFSDIFSGYRALSRRFVKSFPALSRRFEVEAEMSVHASHLSLPFAEVETRYRARVEGSRSKLNTVRDSVRILTTLLLLFKEVRPMAFFGAIGLGSTAAAIVLSIPLLDTYIETGLVPRFPTAILATGLVLLGAIALTCGLVLDSVARGRLEQKRIMYLNQPVPSSHADADIGRST